MNEVWLDSPCEYLSNGSLMISLSHLDGQVESFLWFFTLSYFEKQKCWKNHLVPEYDCLDALRCLIG